MKHPFAAQVCFPATALSSKASVGSKFKKSLQQLTGTLEATEPHYVRCIKSNPSKAPGVLDTILCHEQLTYSGVLEAVKIHQKGFPFRLPHLQFRRRYACVVAGSTPTPAGGGKTTTTALFSGAVAAQAAEVATRLTLVDGTAFPASDLKVGKTLVLYRSAQHRGLEERRTRVVKLARERVLLQALSYVARKTRRELRASCRALASAMAAWDDVEIRAKASDLERLCAKAERTPRSAALGAAQGQGTRVM